MMLLNSQRIVVARRKVRLQIALDVMSHAKLLAQGNHPVRVSFPVNRVAEFRTVVHLSNLVQIDEAVRGLHDGETGFDIQRGFQADPREDTLVAKRLESSNPVVR